MSELEPELPVDAPAVDAPPVEAAPVDAAPVTSEPVAPAPVNWEDMNVLSEAAARLQALGYNLVPATPEPQPENTLPEYDPYNPQAYFDAREEQMLQRIAEQFSPVQQFVASEQDQRVESQIGSQIDSLKTELGYQDGDNRELRALADSFAPDMVARYGQTPAAGKAAIQAAIEHAKARDETIGQKAVEQYKESLRNPRDSTPYEPGVRGVGRPAETGYASELDVARSWRDRQPI